MEKSSKRGNLKLFQVKCLQNRCTIHQRPMFERILSERIPSKKIQSLYLCVNKVKLIYLSFCREPPAALSRIPAVFGSQFVNHSSKQLDNQSG